MELQAARQIIDRLANGVHPETGEPLANESPYNLPAVIRALFAAVRLFDHELAERKRRQPPPNAGKPWQAADDELLRAAHASGRELRELSAELGRTAYAVEARMVKLGLIEAQAGLRLGPLKARESARPYRVRRCPARPSPAVCA